MSSLDVIRTSLQKEDQIRIININEIDRRDNPYLLLHTDLAHVVYFNIVPKNTMDIDSFLSNKMNSLMSYIQDVLNPLAPEEIIPFGQEIIELKRNNENKKGLLLKIGSLWFDEYIGSSITNTFFSIEDKQSRENSCINYKRKIIITPFPSEEISNKYKGVFANWIKLDLKTP
jgi:hypothetical protein